MKYIRNFLTVLTLLLLVVSCEKFSTDLNVENFEHPNDNILTSDPVALTATAGTIMHNWFMAVHSYYGPGLALATMADVSTCSWGNAGMKDLSSEPRVAFNNMTSYTNNVTKSYFNSLYSVLSDANTIIAAVEQGTEFENPAQVEVMGLFGQALSVGYLALVFDKVWLSDENGVIGDGEPSTYAEAMTFALTKLDAAIALANAEGVDIPESWLPGGGGANATFVAFMNSMGARMLVSNVRNLTQKASIDWNRVLAYTNNGLTSDFTIFMDDNSWWASAPQTYLVYPGWGRVDMRIVHMMDPNTTDYWTTESVIPESTSADARLATDYEYLSSQNFNPTRGTYHYSSYRYARLDYYITDWATDIVEYSASENDMYKAEAKLNLSDVSGAADIVNAGTRVTRGNLPPVSADAAAVQSAIFYERMVEFAYTGMGIGFFEMRKENLLQPGTLLHFPVPGQALEAIPADYYTFGGTEGVAGEDYSNGGWRTGKSVRISNNIASSSINDNLPLIR